MKNNRTTMGGNTYKETTGKQKTAKKEEHKKKKKRKTHIQNIKDNRMRYIININKLRNKPTKHERHIRNTIGKTQNKTQIKQTEKPLKQNE